MRRRAWRWGWSIMTTSENKPARPLLPEALPEFENAARELCVRLPVSIGASGLATELSSLTSDLRFHDVLTRGGWYRLGGVVDAHGQHVSDTLTEWGEAELERHNSDLQDLYDAYSNSGLKATRLIGRTHYLVASYGVQATDFIQVEIEELQEVISHVLFEGAVAGSLEDLFEPPLGAKDGKGAGVSASPVSQPFYALRRVTDVSQLVRRIGRQRPEPQNVHRFIDAWEKSSAGMTTHFSNHWLIAVRESLDRYRQVNFQATPIAAMNGPAPRFAGYYDNKGLALNELLQNFDRQVGYPMAWFFHMITTKTVPQAIAYAVVDDIQDGFLYLPDRDVEVLKAWLRRPFAF